MCERGELVKLFGEQYVVVVEMRSDAWLGCYP